MRAKTTISRPALMARINRKLKHQSEQLRAARSERARQDVGDFFIVNTDHNYLARHHVDPEALARKLGVLADWEKVNHE